MRRAISVECVACGRSNLVRPRDELYDAAARNAWPISARIEYVCDGCGRANTTTVDVQDWSTPLEGVEGVEDR